MEVLGCEKIEGGENKRGNFEGKVVGKDAQSARKEEGERGRKGFMSFK